MQNKNQQMEFDITAKENKSSYAYLSGIKDDTRQESSTVNVIFSHQSVIVIFICVIMSLIASFSLGVEKGKLISRDNLIMEKSQASAVAGTPGVAIPAQEKAAGVEKIQNSVQPLVDKNVLAGNKPLAVQNTAAVNVTPEVAVVATPQPASLPTGGYTIQIATVKTDAAAKNICDALAKKGFSGFFKRAGKFYIVLVGHFSKKADAQIKLKELKKTYADCFIKNI